MQCGILVPIAFFSNEYLILIPFPAAPFNYTLSSKKRSRLIYKIGKNSAVRQTSIPETKKNNPQVTKARSCSAFPGSLLNCSMFPINFDVYMQGSFKQFQCVWIWQR